jgi:calcineurin-like phosphoesterase family protein
MKYQFAFAGIFAAIALGGAAHAQTGTGFPPLSPVPQTGQLQNQAGATQFCFIAAGDNRPAEESLPQPQVLTQIFNDAQRFKPVLFLWSGDIIYGHEDHHKRLEKQYKEFFDIAQLAKAPVFNSPGNHEMDKVTKTSTEKTETPDKKLQDYYLEFMKFPSKAPPYGAFNYGNSRFIAVDTEEVGGPSPASPSVPASEKKLKLGPGFVSQVQLGLLTQDLDANKDKAHVFVFMHHPIKPAESSSGLNQDNAAALQALFQKYSNVSYVIAAHEHLYFNATGTTLMPADRQDPSDQGPSYLVSGGAGAPLDNCPDGAGPNCGSYNHYLVFEVDGGRVKVQVIQVQPSAAEKTVSQ